MAERDWIAALEAALGEQDAALRGGALGALDPLAGRIAALTARIVAAPPPPPERLLRLRARAARSADLLAAARRGVGAAQARATAVLNGGAPLSTYGADGHLIVHDSAQRRLEHRA